VDIVSDAQSTPPPAPVSPSFSRGAAIIEDHLTRLPGSPGVYRMLNQTGDALYVGKAKNLKKRVVAYTRPERLPLRLQRMVAETHTLEVVTTHTEVEALLLEANLIKKLAPRYNILLRDDKSFPYILITGDHRFPQIVKHRGARNRKGEYFGPFASAGAVNQTLTQLQRAFLLRSCTDSVFSSRSRPCLLFQIKRCSAPCVERIGTGEYAELVDEARSFLSGRSQQVQKGLVKQMEDSAEAMNYEEAAVFRDRIRALTSVQARQDINSIDLEDADVVALHQAGGDCCIQVFFFRSGCNFGNRAFFPTHTQDQSPEEVLAAFLAQFYEDKVPPRDVMLSHPLLAEDQPLIVEALTQRAGRKVALTVPRRGDRRKMVMHAHDNAREALGRRQAESSATRKLLDGVAELFGLDAPPERIEVYDNSHIQGAHAVGGMIVAGPEGFMKNAYRKFNIKGADIAPGDDFAMMKEVLTRRFKRAKDEEAEGDRSDWPDLLLIDGGPGQFKVVEELMEEMGISDVALVSIAKGQDRDAGRERFHRTGKPSFSLPPNDPVLYYLQRLRDEAHRFAIGTHRAKRSAAIGKSPLDELPGIGPARKKALLHHFGSARGVSEAGLADLAGVEGISQAMAKKIYDYFHPNG
jgi:excinuclease ABC subunit C